MIYLVDDSVNYRFLVGQIFKLFLPQYTLRLFEDGNELDRHLQTSIGAEVPVDLIIMDIDMPGLSGLQLLEQLKHHPAWQAIPVVMMSNDASAERIEACYRVGASSFVSKPVVFNELKEAFTHLCHTWVDNRQKLPRI